MFWNILGMVLLAVLGVIIGAIIFGNRIKTLGTIFLDGEGTAYIKFNDGCTQATLEQRRYAIFEVAHIENAEKTRPTVE